MTDTARNADLPDSGTDCRNSSVFQSLLCSFKILYRDTRFHALLVLSGVVIFSLVWAITALPNNPLADEGFHWTQIVGFIHGGFFSPHITTLPGYHWTMTYLMKFLDMVGIASIESHSAARCVNWFLALVGLLCFHRIVTQSREGNASALTLQYFLSPIIFPFFFLIYTDLASLSLVMVSLLLALNRRYYLAALVAGLSFAFRQTNIMWLFLIWMLALSETGFFSACRRIGDWRTFDFAALVVPLRKTAVFILCCVLFVVFVIINEGIAVGDKEAHSLSRIYPFQVFLLLALLFFLFLPLHIKNAPAIWRLLISQPLLPLLGALLYAVYMITFDASHGYNHINFYIRNVLLEWLRASDLNRSLLFIPILWTFYSLVLTPLREKRFYWLYPVTILYLLPMGVIEQRYFIVPIVLFTLFRKPMDDRLEYLNAAIYVPVAMFIFMGIAEERFFL